MIKNGAALLITVKYDLLKTADAVNILHPNGGVAEPIALCSVTIIPKCIGSIPAAAAGATNIGASIIIATSWSTNIQATKKNKLTTVNILIALGSVPNTVDANICGILPKE